MLKKKESPSITEGGPISTILGKETSFSGVMEFKKPLQINGHFEGELIKDGVLVVGEGATVKANIRAGIVIVAGEVTGNIEARQKLEMLTSGKVYGNVKTAKLQIADGVVFDGNCEMITDGQTTAAKASA
jgi:cytoskeletal protein CcmA (bactofilin family)